MKRWMSLLAGVMILMLLVVPTMAEENARPGITAHKAADVVIDGSLE